MKKLARSYYLPDYLTHSVTNIVKTLQNIQAKSEGFYTCLRNKTCIGIGLTVKQRGIKSIKSFSYKKAISILVTRYVLDTFLEKGVYVHLR